jgi:very-short-patch-repair endonuclease
MSDSRIAPLASQQHGLITRSQLLEVISANTLERWVRARRLEPLYRSISRIAGVPDSWRQRLLAVCLAAGPEAYASFRSAAALHGFERFDEQELEITHFGHRPSAIAGALIHESAVFDRTHLSKIDGIPVTSVARTLCDLTAIVRPWMVERVVDEALRRKSVTLERLARIAEDLEGRGRHKCTVMREILEHRVQGYHPGDSDPEKRIADLLVRAGLPEPTKEHPVRLRGKNYRIDLCYPQQRIAIEYDSWGFHNGRQAFDDDRARGNDLVLLGFDVLRFTSRSGDQSIVDTVAAALRRTSAS